MEKSITSYYASKGNHNVPHHHFSQYPDASLAPHRGWQYGAVSGSFYFLGREIAQAEYRTIEKNYSRKRAKAPWWCGFERRALTRKGVLDWVVPAVAVTLVAALASGYSSMS